MICHHERIVCEKCGAVIMQCRCMEQKVNVPKGLCEKCKVNSMTEEQIDNELRNMGYDPEKIGHKGEVLVKVCIENLELKEKMKNREWLINEWGKLTKESQDVTDIKDREIISLKNRIKELEDFLKVEIEIEHRLRKELLEDSNER